MTGLPQLSRFDSNSPNKNFNSQIFFGNYIHFLPSVTSTNDTAMELAEKGWPEGTVVVSDTQTRGRGRAGRLWHSPKGVSLYFTVILRPGMKLKNAPLITLMAAAASVQPIRKLTAVEAAIKWPNDILVNDKKLGGILTETKVRGEYIDVAVLGIGLNVNLDVSILPVELLDKILNSLETWYKILLSQKHSHIIQSWKSLNITLGRQVRVQTMDKTFTGKAVDIGHTGELIVQTDEGNVVKVVAGDVKHCRL